MSSQNAVLLNEITAILRETFERSNGIYLYRGTSLFETLENVSAQEASLPVCTEDTTLAAQVAHTAFYLRTLRAFMLDPNLPNVDWEEIWLRVKSVSPEEWKALLQEFTATYQETLTFLESLTDWENEDNFSGALAIASHSAYHLGVIRQALHTLKTRS